MIKKLVSYLGEYKAASIKTPLFAALEAIMDVLLPTIMAFIIDQGIEKGDMNAVVKYGLLTFLAVSYTHLWGATLIGRLLIAFVFPLRQPRKAMVFMAVVCIMAK